MSDAGWQIVWKVLAVFAVMGAGVLARRVGWLTREADRSLMRLAVNVMLPSLFFHRVVTDRALDGLGDVLWPPLFGFGSTALGFAVAGLTAALLARPLRLEAVRQRRAFAYCAGIGNYGYIPLPIAFALFPSAATTLIVHNVGVELAFWSIGLLIISGSLGRDAWRRVLNPPVVAISVAVLLRLTGAAAWLPPAIVGATEMGGQAAIPLGLVLSGAIIYDLWRDGQWRANWPGVAAAVAVRLVLLPVAFLLFAKHAGLSVALQKVVVLQAAMPAATFPLVVTKLYDQDTGTAFRVVVGTTLLGLITIPAWIAVGCWYLGLSFG